MLRRTTYALVLVLALAIGARADDGAPNAALRYWPAWSTHLTPGVEQRLRDAAARIGEDDWRVESNAAQDFGGDEFVRALVESSRLPRCDMGLDRAKGPTLELPDAGRFLASARALAVHARLRAEAGDRPGAAELLAAGNRIAGHCAAQRTGVHSSTALAMLRTIDSVAARADLQRAFTSEQRAALRESLSWVDASDPCSFRAAFVAEGESLAAWLRSETVTPAGVERVMDVFESIRSIDDVTALPWARGPMLVAIQREGGFAPAADAIERYHHDAREAMTAGNPPLELARVVDRLREGDYGSLARAIAADPAAFRKRSLEAGSLISDAQARWQSTPG